MKKITLLITLFLNVMLLNAKSKKDDFEKEFDRAEKIYFQIHQNGKATSTIYEGANSHKEAYVMRFHYYWIYIKDTQLIVISPLN